MTLAQSPQIKLGSHRHFSYTEKGLREGVEEDFRTKFKDDKMKLIAYLCTLIAFYCF